MPPFYTFLDTEKLREADLSSAIAHCNRNIPVPNAILNKPDGWKRIDGTDLEPLAAYYKRVRESGAKVPKDQSYVVMEVLLTLSPGNEKQPNAELFYERSMKFCRTKWAENVLFGFGHQDEQTLHAHVFVALICEGLPPGRIKGGKAGKLPGPVISWNIFSGSSKVKYRKDQSGPKQKRNEEMASWQTDFAFVWADHGYRRGYRKSRRTVRPQLIQEKTDKIAAVAETAKEEVIALLKGITLPSEMIEGKTASEVNEAVRELLKNSVLPQIETQLAHMEELAKRGIQLPLEQESRKVMGDRIEALQEQLAALPSTEQIAAQRDENAALSAENIAVRNENSALKAENIALREVPFERLSWPEICNVGRHFLAALPEAELEMLFKEEHKRRHPKMRPLSMPKFPKDTPGQERGQAI